VKNSNNLFDKRFMINISKLEQSLPRLVRNNWQLLVFGIVHAFIFLYVFKNGLYGWSAGDDMPPDYLYALYMSKGYIPYRDFAVEYPPLAMVFAFLPKLVSAGYSGYIWSYCIEMLLFDLLGLFVIYKIAREFHLIQWKTLGAYTLALLAIGPLITIRFDIIPAVIVLLSLYFFIKGHHTIAWGLLAAGTLTKIYPIVLAPLFLIYHWRYRQYKTAVTGLICFVVVCLIIVAPLLIISPDGLWHSLTYHTQRGLQIESSYASFLELLYGFGLINLDFIFNFGSTNIVSPVGDVFANIYILFTLAGLLVVYFVYSKRLRIIQKEEGFSQLPLLKQSTLLGFSLISILAFMLTSKVFSPQYIIWIYPLIILISGKWRKLSILLFVMIGLMTFFVYPEFYENIQKGQLTVIAMLVLRNVALVLMALILLKSKQALTNWSEPLKLHT
jgi:uncharacterized membrane protein